FELYLDAFNSLADGTLKGAPFFQLQTSGSEGHRTQQMPPEFYAFRDKLLTYVQDHGGRKIRLYLALHFPTRSQPAAAKEIESQAATVPGPVVPRDDSKTLRIEKFWTPHGRFALPPGFELRSYNATWCDGRVWLFGYSRDNAAKPPQMQRYIFSVDPVTMQSDA